MLTDRPNGRSGDVQLDSPSIRSLTVQRDDGPMDCPCYVNLDRPNGKQSNGPPMLLQFGPSKIRIMDRSKIQLLTVILDRQLLRFGTLFLDRLKLQKKMLKVLVNTTVGHFGAV